MQLRARPPALWAAAAIALAAGPHWAALGDQYWKPAETERQRQRCSRSPDAPAVRVPNDLATRFGPLLAGEAFAEHQPKVLSTDPLIVYFDAFMSEEEVAECESVVFTREFTKSRAGYGGKHEARHSETSFCLDDCDKTEIVQTILRRASNISNVPVDNFDFVQALRYKEGMFYKGHNDNHPTFHFLPCGTRIFSFFVYLSDEGLEGGATNFPTLQIEVPAKRGAAVLFATTKDEDPLRTDTRTLHESLVVTKGEKRGLNMWLYQYNYRRPWAKGCTSIELADNLGKLGKAAVGGDGSKEIEPVRPQVRFVNKGKAELRVLWIDNAGEEKLIETVRAGGRASLDSFVGHVFHLRTAGGELVRKYTVNSEPQQEVRLDAETDEL